MKMAKSPLISVIVPVYNVEKYLGRCLDSILAQTYKNLEVILVDDGSTDGSGEICHKYLELDKRVRVIKQKKSGIAVVRNNGLKNATGDLLTFVDSDDYIEEIYLEKMYNVMQQVDADIVTCRQGFVYEDGRLKMEKRTGKIKVLDSITAINEMLYQKSITSAVWGKLYKKNIFEGISFPAGKIHEDLAVMYKLFKKTSSVAIVDLNLYYYMQRQGSLINSKFSETTLDVLDIVDEIDRDARGGINEPAAKSRKINAEIFVLRQLPRKKYKMLYKRLVSNIKKERRIVLLDKNVRVKTKIGLLLSYFGMPTLKIVYNIFSNSYSVRKV